MRKRTLVFTILFALILSGGLTACSENRGEAGYVTDFRVRYERTDGCGAQYPGPGLFMLRSYDEFLAFYNAHQETCRGDEWISCNFSAAFAAYTETFFDDRYLLIIRQSEPSSSISHEVERIDANGNITIKRFMPEIGTAELAEWHILLELDKGFRPEQFDGVFIEQ